MKRKLSDIAWAAGLFEGEGSVGVSLKNGRTGTIYASLSMTDGDVVERFHAVIGFGKLKGPYKRTGAAGERRKDMYCWSTHRHEYVQALVAMFWARLGDRRREQAKRALLHANNNMWTWRCKTSPNYMKKRRTEHAAKSVNKGNGAAA